MRDILHSYLELRRSIIQFERLKEMKKNSIYSMLILNSHVVNLKIFVISLGLIRANYVLKCNVVLFSLQEKIKALQAELQTVAKSKTMLERELQEVITLTSTELEEYQEKVMELEDEVNIVHCVFSLNDVDCNPV